jgi:chemotaxis protein MotB
MAEEEDDGMPTAPFWMATFSDMVTLLLAFFVMLVAMSEVEVKKFKDALSYFSGSTGPMEYQDPHPSTRKSAESTFLSRRKAEQYEKLLKYIHDRGLENVVQVNLTERGLHVVITDSVMFRSGEAALIEPSRSLLRTLVGILGEGDVGGVLVEGHTDDRPIQTARFPSNWELSAARASSVVRYLLEQPYALPPEQYTAMGHGEHRPVAPNTSPEERARNRRVEILFEWVEPEEPKPLLRPDYPTEPISTAPPSAPSVPHGG